MTTRAGTETMPTRRAERMCVVYWYSTTTFNLVSSTLPCICQPGQRLRVLDVLWFRVNMHTVVHRFLAFELLVNNASSGTLAFSLRLVPFLPAADSPATHAGSSASPFLAPSSIPWDLESVSSDTLPPYCLL